MKWTVIPVAILATAVSLGAQSPSLWWSFAGAWVGDAPMPGGRRVPIMIGLTLVLGDRVVGTLKVGDTDMVSIEEGRVRGGMVSFHRTLSDDGSRMHFLAELIDDSLRVRFMHDPAADARAPRGSSEVVIFTATRVAGAP